MKEIDQIINAYNRLDPNTEAALATVVHVEGSSYRRPGARMLITDDGKLTGAISGGCLEGDALRKALLVIHKGEAMVVIYDTTDEDDAKLGVGLGCNGIIHVLIEPLIASDPRNPVELLKVLAAERRNGILVTLFSLQDKSAAPGTCALFTGEEHWISSAVNGDLAQLIRRDAGIALGSNQSFFKKYNTEGYAAFIELIPPVISLVIIGAGNDILPLTEFAHTLGWKTTVIDGRASHATTARFPLAGTVIVSKPEAIGKVISHDPQTCYLLMTHNYNYDLSALKGLLKLDAPYIGVLGPKKKMQRMIEELGFHSLNDLPAVYGPVGLDIGAESPEEIALSIVAEIKAAFAGKDLASLRDLPESIHLRTVS